MQDTYSLCHIFFLFFPPAVTNVLIAGNLINDKYGLIALFLFFPLIFGAIYLHELPGWDSGKEPTSQCRRLKRRGSEL